MESSHKKKGMKQCDPRNEYPLSKSYKTWIKDKKKSCDNMSSLASNNMKIRTDPWILYQ